MDYWLYVVNIWVLSSVLAVSLNLLVGYSGLMSLAHAAIAGTGAYVAAVLATSLGLSPWLSLVVAVAASTLLGTVIALPALFMSSDHLILLTLALAVMFSSVVTAIPGLGGAYGILGIPPLTIGGLELRTSLEWMPVILVISGLAILFCARIAGSPFGRLLIAAKDDPDAARASGKSITRARLQVFVLTSAVAGLAGAMFAFYDQLATPGLWDLNKALALVTMVIIGGPGNLVGSILGAAIVTFTQPVLEQVVNLAPDRAGLISSCIYGITLIAVLLLRPQGLLPMKPWRSRFRPRPFAAETVPSPRRKPHVEGEIGLEGGSLTKVFGGVTAVNDVSLQLPAGKVTALVGPNGAGKTSLFNLLAGRTAPDRGEILLRSRDVTGHPPAELARRGLTRSFQDVRLFPSLSALDNIAVGVAQQPGESLWRLFFTPRTVARAEKDVRARAQYWLARFGIEELQASTIFALPYGQQKIVGLSRALVNDSEIVLLDEPLSGIEGPIADRTLEVIDELRKAGMTFCVVEHSVSILERIADSAYFMEAGAITAEGTIAELIAQPRLAEVYFGGK